MSLNKYKVNRITRTKLFWIYIYIRYLNSRLIVYNCTNVVKLNCIFASNISILKDEREANKTKIAEAIKRV